MSLALPSIVTMVVPQISDDRISTRLRQLTRKLIDAGMSSRLGLLGGADGYGCEFKNEVFEMRPFDCCADCTCDESPCIESCDIPVNFRCGPFWIRWYKYIGRGMEGDTAGMSAAEVESMFDRCEESLRGAS